MYFIMKKIFTILAMVLIATSFFTSCEKDDYPDGSSTSTTGIISFVNTSKNSYSIYIDDRSYGSIPGGKYKDIIVKVGTHSYKVSQNEGYVMYPTVGTGQCFISPDEKVVVSFPQ